MPVNSCPISWITKERFTEKQNFVMRKKKGPKPISAKVAQESSGVSVEGGHKVSQDFCPNPADFEVK